jgi:hypothetical protein
MAGKLDERDTVVLRLLSEPLTLEQLTDKLCETFSGASISYQTTWRIVDQLEKRGLVDVLPVKSGKANLYRSNFATLEEEGQAIQFTLRSAEDGTVKKYTMIQLIDIFSRPNFSIRLGMDLFGPMLAHLIVRSHIASTEGVNSQRIPAPSEKYVKNSLMYTKDQLIRVAELIDIIIASPIFNGQAYKLAGPIEDTDVYEKAQEFFLWFMENGKEETPSK